jgi:wobble nucleotide-excising tRNase
MPPIISKISSISGIHVFRDPAVVSDLPEFKRYNLIYGFNGSGKTSLSRVFASLQKGALAEKLPPQSGFKFLLDDASEIQSDRNLDLLKSRILVFNGDFVEESLQWTTRSASPIYFIGKAQADLAKRRESLERKLPNLEDEYERADKAQREVSKAFETRKTAMARSIESNARQGARKFNATQLVKAYAEDPDVGAALPMTEAQIKDYGALADRAAPLPKLAVPTFEDLFISKLVSECRDRLTATLGSIALEELKENESMLPWIKTGLSYHQSKELSKCLFCSSDIPNGRLESLATTIDDKYDALITGIQTLHDATTRSLEKFRSLTMYSSNDISVRQEDFKSASEIVATARAKGIEILESLVSALRAKLSRPNVAIDLDKVIRAETSSEVDRQISYGMATLADLIGAHNKAHDDFATEQDNARNSLRRHYLRENYEEYASLESSEKNAVDTAKQKKIARDAAREEIDALKRRMREHQGAAETLNKLIANYLGRTEIEFRPREEGYEIFRSGAPMTGWLSEGERTAIALCYFLTLLEADGRHLRDLIIVLDDPISSLDSGALNYAFCMLKSRLDNSVSQLFILTHNLNFMNEVKKWLKNRAKSNAETGKDPTAALVFLNSFQKPGEPDRRTRFQSMPKYIREYESEYHYLFHIILRFIRKIDEPVTYFFVLPNALRKVLDVFLAFKVPGSFGLDEKIRKLLSGLPPELDRTKFAALERLSQVESHGDSLDDLITQSSMTVEEAERAANSLVELMRASDAVHYNALESICRPAN